MGFSPDVRIKYLKTKEHYKKLLCWCLSCLSKHFHFMEIRANVPELPGVKAPSLKAGVRKNRPSG